LINCRHCFSSFHYFGRPTHPGGSFFAKKQSLCGSVRHKNSFYRVKETNTAPC
jgi:hypothetical protein